MTHALASFEDLVDLANEKIGGAAVACSDDFFAGMAHLVKSREAVFDVDAYGDNGKIMDGWESRRSHDNALGPDGTPSHADWCIVRLGAPGLVHGVVIDTAFFKGNFPSHALLEGTSIEGYPSPDEVAKASWVSLVPKSALQGDSKNKFPCVPKQRVTHVRLRIFPDGGVARLRVYGTPLADLKLHGGLDNELDLAAAELGGIVESCSDMFFGSRHNLLFPGLSGGMHDGWETRRSRRVGHDWAVVRLGVRGVPSRIVVDTSHFKGNPPAGFALDGALMGTSGTLEWHELFPRVTLQAHTRHVFHAGIATRDVTHVRLRIDPDGGVARFRLYGHASAEGKQAHILARINAMLPREADGAFLSACGSRTWAAQMAGARAYASWGALETHAGECFARMAEADWLEAFAAHPRIGALKAGHQESNEQRAMSSAADPVRARMAELNDAYFAKHGFIYIVKASGKSADEMLALLEQRVKNDRGTEIKNASDEQRKITALRLERLC